MYSFAQTNIQLFNQLRCNGYSDDDLKCIFDAYKLATCLFTGMFRGSGKTFIAHLVGTASILTSIAAPVEVIAAGLIHAAYEFGDFGDGSRGISDSKRFRIRQVVGQLVEEYVAKYTALLWNEQTILNVYSNLTQLNVFERNVILIRLANELEDHMDFGVIYCGNTEKRLVYIEHSGKLMAEIAVLLGYPTLSNELTKIFQATLSTQIPTLLKSHSDYSYLIPNSPGWRRYFGKLNYKIIYMFGQLRSQFNNSNGY